MFNNNKANLYDPVLNIDFKQPKQRHIRKWSYEYFFIMTVFNSGLLTINQCHTKGCKDRISAWLWFGHRHEVADNHSCADIQHTGKHFLSISLQIHFYVGLQCSEWEREILFQFRLTNTCLFFQCFVGITEILWCMYKVKYDKVAWHWFCQPCSATFVWIHDTWTYGGES